MKPVVTPATRERAFTLLELVVIVFVLGLLGLHLLSAASRGGASSSTVQCLHNAARLMQACQMYAADNDDRFPQNYQGGSAQGGNFPTALGPGWAAGWLDWTTSPDNTNLAFLVNSRYAVLGRYLGGNASTFKCPADTALSLQQRARGWAGRLRSYSASAGIGQGNAESGPWDLLYRHVTNTSTLLFPNPAETFVYVDENSDSINDPAIFSPSAVSWVDVPAARHKGAGVFSFADGHAAVHQWTGSLRQAPGPASDADRHWVSYRTQRVSKSSY